jgi:flagellar basal body-associated protein FliL
VDVLKKKMPLIIILALVVILAAAAAVYFFVIRPKSQTPAEPVYYDYKMEDSFVTNVKNSKKLFKATIVLVADSPDLAEMVTAKTPEIRDTILFILRDLTEEEIDSSDIQDKLRAEIPEALNEKLQIENFTSVYFGDFVMQ